MKTSKKVLSLLLIAAMLVSVLCMGVYAADAPVIAGGVHAQFGDPDKTPTVPESLMALEAASDSSETNPIYNAVYTGSDSALYYPDILSLCAYTSNNASDAVRLVSASNNIVFATYDANGEHTTSEITYATNQNLNEAGQLVSSSIYTVKLSGAGSVTVYNGNALAFTVRFETPKSNAVAGGTAPKFVNGYLPIGQYASGQAWGSIYSSLTNMAGNDANTDRTVTTDAPTKITSGYADVRNVGSNKDGTACNPYASVPTSGSNSVPGGDGFDISWAVDSYGNPHYLSTVKYVRVYTSAALSASNLNIMPTPGIFGETSTEVCGLFVANKADSNVGVTDAPVSISVGGGVLGNPTDIEGNVFIYDLGGLISDDAVVVTAGIDCNLFINDGRFVAAEDDTETFTGTYTVETDDQVIRVIVQTGDKAPYIAIIK